MAAADELIGLDHELEGRRQADRIDNVEPRAIREMFLTMQSTPPPPTKASVPRLSTLCRGAVLFSIVDPFIVVVRMLLATDFNGKELRTDQSVNPSEACKFRIDLR